MLDTFFAHLYRAVDRIRDQLEYADEDLRRHLAEELDDLEAWGTRILDRWLLLDERIQELKQTFQLTGPSTDAEPAVDLKMPGDAPTPLTVWFVPGEHADADPTLEQLVMAAPHPTQLAFRRGMGYLDLEMYAEAAQSFASAVEDSDDLVARIYLAAALSAQGRRRLSMSQLAAVRARTRDALLLNACDEVEAWNHAQVRAYDQAAACLEAVVRRTPEYGDAWYNLALCYLQLGNGAAAEQAAMRALEQEPRDVDAAALLALVHVERGDPSAACRVCHTYLPHAPQHAGLAVAYVRALAAAGEIDRALSHCRRWCGQHPDDDTLHRLYVRLLLRAGREEEARARLKKRIALHLADASDWLTLSVLQCLDGEYDKAEASVSRALECRADPALAMLVLGAIQAGGGEREDARSYFLQALRDPRRPVKRLSLFYLGRLALENGEAEEALRYFKAARVLGPANAAIAEWMGRADAARRAAARPGQPAESCETSR